MDVDVVLVCLMGSGSELCIPVDGEARLRRRRLSAADDPHQIAQQLATGCVGTDRHVARHAFRTPHEGAPSALELVYRQLLPHNDEATQSLDRRLAALHPGNTRLLDATIDESDAQLVASVVDDLRQDLRQVMHARLNKRGLIHLLQLLPEIFDHKELKATYAALAGEKPASALMLARMMLDKYTIGSGEKARDVQGRDLIREYEEAPHQIRSEKWAKNRELYRRGGPKAKRLYQQLLR